jgi:hypothetical protein
MVSRPRIRIPHATEAVQLLFSTNKNGPHKRAHFYNGGEGGIRTLERVAPLLDFESSAFNHSATSPKYDFIFAEAYS